MKHRILTQAAIVGLLLPGAPAARAGALNEEDHTPTYDWHVQWHNRDSSDKDYCSDTNAKLIMDSLDSNSGRWGDDPDGMVRAFLDLGFPQANISGNDLKIEYIDKNRNITGNWVAAGNANRNRLKIHSEYASSTSYSDLNKLGLVGHELFHGIQYNYVGAIQDERLGDFAIEGQPDAMVDRAMRITDLDRNSDFRSRVDFYLKNPDSYLYNLGLSGVEFLDHYDTALWWSYLAEQYGGNQVEPGSGSDFLLRYWQNAAGGSTDSIELLKETIAEHTRLTTVENRDFTIEELFNDFAVANLVKDDTFGPEIANPGRFRYRDDDDPDQEYASVPTNQISPPLSPADPANTASGAVRRLGADYHAIAVSSTCTGIVGVNCVSHDDDKCTFNVAFYKGFGPAQYLDQLFIGGTPDSPGNNYAVSLAQDPADPYTAIKVIVTGVDGGAASSSGGSDLSADYDLYFGCGEPTIDILQPSALFPAYVNAHDEPDRFVVRLQVSGPVGLGSSTVQGLAPEMFRVWVGDGPAAEGDPANEAEILLAYQVLGEFWLTCHAPAKVSPLPTTYGLKVQIEGVTEDFASDVVIYQEQKLDQQLVVDHSGSMNTNGKIDAANLASMLFIDASQLDDQIGITTFSGDDIEPNMDATLALAMTTLDNDFARILVKSFAGAGSASGFTSIGDGLFIANNDLITNGAPDGENWAVLLSDGVENEPQYVENVLPGLIAAGTRVFAIALGALCDQPLLEDLAYQTNGRFLYVEEIFSGSGARSLALPSSTVHAVGDAFMTATEEIQGLERIWEVSGTAGSVTHMVESLQPNVTKAIFRFQWADPSHELNVVIKRPDGSIVADTDPGVDINSDDTHTVYLLDDLPAGSWEVTLTGTTGVPQYYASLSAKDREGPQMELNFAADHGITGLSGPGLYAKSLPQIIQAGVADIDGPIRGATVRAEITNPDNVVVELTLFDDGGHSDGFANDGVYANVFSRTARATTTGMTEPNLPARGSYAVAVEATGQDNNGIGFTRIKKGAFVMLEDANQLPDTDGDGLIDLYESRISVLDPHVADSAGDADGNGLSNLQEMRAGLHPLVADYDGGGESDKSERDHGRNPFDPTDDALPAVVDAEVLKHRADNLLPDDHIQPETNRIRFRVNPAYHEYKLFRSTSETGPFSLVATIPVADLGGSYQDTGLVNNTTYYYFIRARTAGNAWSADSHIFSGTPRLDSVAPGGWIVIENEGGVVATSSVELSLLTDSDVTGMIVSNSAGFTGAAWELFSASKAWTITPDSSGRARVFARFRDAAGNESQTVSATVTVVAAATRGAVTGIARLSPTHAFARNEDILVSARKDGDVIQTRTYPETPGGAWGLNLLEPGTYEITFTRTGYQTVVVTDVVVTAGTSPSIPTVTLTALDSDDDGLLDIEEASLGTDEDNPDTDGDGLNDGKEVADGSDPLDSTSPRIVLFNLHYDASVPSFSFDFTSKVGEYYTIEHLDDSTGGIFQFLNLVPGEKGSTHFTDSSGEPMRLYRVKSP